MRQVAFVIALCAASGVWAQPVTRKASGHHQQVDVTRQQRARSIETAIGQVQLDALVNKIVAEDMPAARKPILVQLASR